MAKFTVGQSVIYSSQYREQVGLPEVTARIVLIYEQAGASPTRYDIEYVSEAGKALVKEEELRAVS